MSKIYEALLRAELDRTTGRSGDVEPQRPTVKPDEPVHAIEHAPTPVRPTVVNMAQTQRASEEPVRRSIAVQEHIWEYDHQSLPALGNRGRVVEQFRTLRSRLQGFRNEGKLRSIVVSSAKPQEGKSYVAANLAITFARHRAAKVLLVDGDMRRATLHRLLGAPREPGLTEYLAGKSSVDDIIQRGVSADTSESMPKGLASLDFIPAGGDAGNASDLSGHARFGELVSSLSSVYDWIVIDSSPVTAVADAVNLARASDGILLVARAGVTRLESAQRAINEFRGRKLLGVVLNAVPEGTGKNDHAYEYDGPNA